MNLLENGVLTLDKKDHKYAVDGREIIGLTEAIHSVGLYDFLDDAPTDKLIVARERGKDVHRATELWDRGTLDVASIRPEIKGYLDAWKSFVAMKMVSIVMIETPVYSKRWRFACTPDRVIFTKDLGVLEIKASDYNCPTYQIQTAGQAIAVGETLDRKIGRRYVVRLFDDGKYRLDEYKDPLDRERFLCALKIAQFKKERL